MFRLISPLFKLALCALFLAPPAAFCDVGERIQDIVDEVVPRSRVSNEQMRALRQELKIQRMFIEGIKGIEIRGGELVDVQRATGTIEDLIKNSFAAKTESLPAHLKQALQSALKESINKDGARSSLKKLKDFIWKQAASKKVALTSSARRFGFDVGLVYMLSLQIDLTFPTVMMAMGHVEFAPLLVTPVSSVATGSYAALKSVVKARHLIKSLGGAGEAREHWRVFKKVKEFFHTSIFPRHDLVDINVAGKNFALTVERQGLLAKFKQRLGWNRNLNYQNLAAYLEDFEQFRPLLHNIASSARPEEVKLLRLLHTLEMRNDLSVMEGLKAKFGGFVNEMAAVPEFSKGRNWAAKISTARDFDQFARLMMDIPEDIPPKVFDKIWRNHILGQASRNVGPFIDKETYIAFRNLQSNWDKGLRKAMAESVELSLGPHWKSQLAEYFFSSLPSVNACGSLFNRRGENSPLL